MRLKKWRDQRSFAKSSDHVTGGQIGNLQEAHCWIDWELANPNERDAVINDAIVTIERLAIPYFALFEDLPKLSLILTNKDLPDLSIGDAVEFLMCFTDQQTARDAAATFLQRHPNLVEGYRDKFKKYAERGLDPSYPYNDPSKAMAFSSHAFEFGDLTEDDT